MVGLIDGSLSTLAPIFAVVLHSHDRRTRSSPVSRPRSAPGSAWRSPKASPTPAADRPRKPVTRGAITGAGTFVGGILHTLPFLISQYHTALVAAVVVVAFELVALAWLRYKFFETSFLRSFMTVTLGGVAIAAISAAVGSA